MGGTRREEMGVGELTSPPEGGWWFRERTVLRDEEWLAQAVFKLSDNQDGVETGPRTEVGCQEPERL